MIKKITRRIVTSFYAKWLDDVKNGIPDMAEFAASNFDFITASHFTISPAQLHDGQNFTKACYFTPTNGIRRVACHTPVLLQH
jgi:hypothetical protein